MTTSESALQGVLPVDKPEGPSSHDVVGLARRALQTRRIGHTGTLDPFASGLLLLCIGTATRIAEYLSGLDKRYHASVRLGVTTDTDDLTGEIMSRRDPSAVTADAIEAALAGLRGDVFQTPPRYSAKKRAGVRAYAAARAGRAVELEPVAVRIDALTIARYEPPELELDVACGSGTYIRAIARDLGDALGVGGHLTALRRTAVGRFNVESAVRVDELDDAQRVRAALLTPAAALAHLPAVALDEREVVDVRHGRRVRTTLADAEPVVFLGAGSLIAVGAVEGGLIRPRKVFL
jgi:tRNA pseudouridine55 synthase